MVSLDDAIEGVKQQYGFSDRAWVLFREHVERADEAEYKLGLAVARYDRLRTAFIRHRTATHEVAPSFCKTCRESDAALAE